MIKKQLQLINDMIIYYGVCDLMVDKLINAIYETYTIYPEKFNDDDEKYMFLLIDKISQKYN